MSQELIAKQKAIADDVLEKLFLIDPYCIVAGGAPRDWWHGKPANDIDAFVHVRNGTTLGIINLMLEKAGFTITSYKEEGSIPEMYKKNPDLRCVINIGNYETPVQIMIMREPIWDSVINKFPLSICKAWYKHGKVDVDKDFLIGEKWGLIFKTSTLYNSGDAYLQKVTKYYPDHTYYSSKEDALSSIINSELWEYKQEMANK
jgi:hypothetical protein